MPLDGVFLSFLTAELNEKLAGARVNKIHQPTRQTLIFHFSKNNQVHRLIISASAGAPRVYLAEQTPENPEKPPSLCMFLRKKLARAKLTGVWQLGIDRVIFLQFDAKTELGDHEELTLAVELLSRRPNVLLLGGNQRILAAMRWVSADESDRPILVNLPYSLPPPTEKFSLINSDLAEVSRRIFESGEPLHESFLKFVDGISPAVSRELATRVNGLGGPAPELIERVLQWLGAMVAGKKATPFLIFEEERIKNFSFLEYEGAKNVCQLSFSAALEAFYKEQDSRGKTTEKISEISKKVKKILARKQRKLAAQTEELDKARENEIFRTYADLINANLHRIPLGSSLANVENFYEETAPKVEILLDAQLTPAKNAQKYYKFYKKSKSAQIFLEEEIKKSQLEISYLESVLEQLPRQQTSADVEEVEDELRAQGHFREKHQQKKTAKPRAFLEFEGPGGVKVFVGKNNRQNEYLTFKRSAKANLWLHAKDVPGAHVVVCSEGEQISDELVNFAAFVAGKYSKLAGEPYALVDFTLVKNVKRMPGGGPGMVIYDDFKTLRVNLRDVPKTLLNIF